MLLILDANFRSWETVEPRNLKVSTADTVLLTMVRGVRGGDETLRKIWIRNVRRDNLVIKRTTTVCSRHFVSTDVIQGGRRRLKEGAVPVLLPDVLDVELHIWCTSVIFIFGSSWRHLE
uniref:THAP-type domain-containing protein n=1 Tax=Monopterus albus TaxID=43700 RepID=A0A3Q3IKP6_MONAL